jgi:large subunit ribosomal protein L21
MLLPYGILEMCGRQFWIEPTRYYDISQFTNKHIESNLKTILFNKVLFLNENKENENAKIGQPFVDGVFFQAKVVAQGQGSKVKIFKMKSKKKYRRRFGYRSKYTRIHFDGILNLQKFKDFELLTQ